MDYKCAVFDLDGTLVNSIHALTYCTNLALKQFQLGPLTEEQMMHIVGDGYKMQMRRSLLAGGDAGLLHYEEILPVYMEIFAENCLYNLHAYEGIPGLLSYLRKHEEHLCDTCRERMQKNPLRVIDCKVPECKEIVKDAPRTIEYLDDECRIHFDELQSLLTQMGIPFEVDTGIVRGLDYYTKPSWFTNSNTVLV